MDKEKNSTEEVPGHQNLSTHLKVIAPCSGITLEPAYRMLRLRGLFLFWNSFVGLHPPPRFPAHKLRTLKSLSPPLRIHMCSSPRGAQEVACRGRCRKSRSRRPPRPQRVDGHSGSRCKTGCHSPATRSSAPYLPTARPCEPCRSSHPRTNTNELSSSRE